jgi:hypothetical protein
MCLITNDKTKYIAEENITVYKKLEPSDNSRYCGKSASRGHKYQWGEQPEIEMKESNDWTPYNWESLDACRNIYPSFVVSHVGKVPQEQRNIFMCIGAGYHSMSKDNLYNQNPLYHFIVKCIIPKGAEYYKDMTGLYVSNKLILIEKENS